MCATPTEKTEYHCCKISFSGTSAIICVQWETTAWISSLHLFQVSCCHSKPKLLSLLVLKTSYVSNGENGILKYECRIFVFQCFGWVGHSVGFIWARAQGRRHAAERLRLHQPCRRIRPAGSIQDLSCREQTAAYANRNWIILLQPISVSSFCWVPPQQTTREPVCALLDIKVLLVTWTEVCWTLGHHKTNWERQPGPGRPRGQVACCCHQRYVLALG